MKTAPPSSAGRSSAGSKASTTTAAKSCRTKCGMTTPCDKKYYSFPFHSKCYDAAIRARHRFMRLSATSPEAAEELVKRDVKMMQLDGDAWAAEVAHSLPNASKEEKRVAQVKLKDYAKAFEITEKLEQTLTKKQKLRFRRRHFIRFWKKWEESDTDACNAAFDGKHEQQQGAFDFTDSSGVECDNPKIVSEEKVAGRSTRTGVWTPFPPSPPLDPNEVFLISNVPANSFPFETFHVLNTWLFVSLVLLNILF